MLKTRVFPPFSTFAAAVGLLLAGCVNFSALDDLNEATPSGSPFSQALFKDYAFLAHSFGDIGQASYPAFDQEGSISIAKTDNAVAALANSFAEKAVLLSRGETVDPEPSKDLDAHNMRDRLVRALVPGRDTFPRDAARAQADYDCWQLNTTVTSQMGAAMRCRRSLDVTLSRLESEVQTTAPTPDHTPVPGQAPAQAPAQTPAAAPAPQSSTRPPTFTVAFDFDSWALNASAIDVLQQAVTTARAGGQPKIVVVGHTDTAGRPEYNMRLSAKRADVVRDALVDLGARRDAIECSGVGETDLAVQTADGVREPKNRRSVITLVI